MTAKCSNCDNRWIVSVLQKIPKSGYICPYCSVRVRLIRAGIIKEGEKKRYAGTLEK